MLDLFLMHGIFMIWCDVTNVSLAGRLNTRVPRVLTKKTETRTTVTRGRRNRNELAPFSQPRKAGRTVLVGFDNIMQRCAPWREKSKS